MADTPSFTLRHLPLPAKLVVTVFLLTVGLGYFAALVQLHFQHSDRDGKPMPSVENVVAIFAGKKWQKDNDSAKPITKLERLIMGPVEGAPWNGSGSMAPAFFHKDDAGTFKKAHADADEEGKKKLVAEREGERLALKAWINATLDVRKAAFEADKFTPPEPPTALTPDYLHDGKQAVKVKSILVDRCTRCHAKDADPKAEAFPLETFEHVMKYMDAPAPTVPPGGGWVDSGRKMSLEKLTQSTHAHLLSFAVLFSLTGLVFAFTGYPTVVRCVLGPLVLLAQVADIACWWLARLPESGPYFAMCIIGTGGVVGLGLAAQIVLSLLSMYGWFGRTVLVALAVAAGAGGAALYQQHVGPYLESEKSAAKQ